MNTRPAILIALLAHSGTLLAQCDFTPIISPGEVILCPGESILLSTEEYESYQWFKDGSPIPGATGQTHLVEQSADAGSSFTVAGTLEGCTATSAPVLVDGYVFLLPYVIHGGDEPYESGEVLKFCEGEMLTLTLSPGYTQHITWYRNGESIPDEASPVLEVTTNGIYTVSAAPEACPNSVMGIGVDIVVEFTPIVRPQIVELGDQLCVQPTGNSTQWYLNGSPTETTDCIVWAGSSNYTAFVDYGLPCQGMSDPFIIQGISPLAQPAAAIAPAPADQQVTITWSHAIPVGTTWRIVDGAGRSVLTGQTVLPEGLQIDVGSLPPGNYTLVMPGAALAPARIVIAR